VKRRFRLTRSNDIRRVRRNGKSFAHPLVVLVLQNSTESTLRVAIITGKSIGGAVERNLTRRRLRAICDRLIPEMTRGFEAILIAREPCSRASFEELEQAVRNVFLRAGLIVKSNE